MALPPRFAGQKLVFGAAAAAAGGDGDDGVAPQPHTLEVFLDYVCPYSARMFATLYHAVAPAVRADPAWAEGRRRRQLQVVFRQQVQPWHPSSTLAHEAALAVLQAAPARFWAFSDALFRDQRAYFDVAVAGESRNQTYRRLARLAAASVPGLGEDDVYARLAIPDKAADDGGGSLNVGNAVTNDLKVLVRIARLLGVHVSPTVIFDGVVAADISSGWTKEQWLEWLDKNIT